MALPFPLQICEGEPYAFLMCSGGKRSMYKIAKYNHKEVKIFVAF